MSVPVRPVKLEDTAKEKSAIIDEIYRSYIEKDIAFLLRVERIDAFGNLIRMLADQIGAMVNLNELSSTAGISVQTGNFMGSTSWGQVHNITTSWGQVHNIRLSLISVSIYSITSSSRNVSPVSVHLSRRLTRDVVSLWLKRCSTGSHP